jgi:hypothetical protein
MWILLICIIFPFFDMCSFVLGVGSVMLVANLGVRQAATCGTFSEALASIQKTEQSLAIFRNFAKMTPTGGTTSGVSLVVIVTPTGQASAQPLTFTAPGSIPVLAQATQGNAQSANYNQSNCIYQYMCTGAYDVLPLFNMHGVPVIGGVPIVGKPVPVKYTSMAAVEHIDGLNN